MMHLFQQAVLLSQPLVRFFSLDVGDSCSLPRTLPDPINTVTGTCQEESSCSGYVTPGLCHGADSIKCCTDTFAPDNGPATSPGFLSDFGATFIHGAEGYRGNFYCDGTHRPPRGGGRHCEPDEGNLTIGWGHLCRPESACNDFNVPMSQAEGDALFQSDVATRVNYVNSLLTTTGLTQNQFDALVSFHFNTGSFANIVSYINSGDFDTATSKMKQYINSGTPPRLDRNLVQRRALEVNLFES